ncbi:ferrous iron transport protein B [bacterium]|nr:ferrous iron transport protein B [bacterium]
MAGNSNKTFVLAGNPNAGKSSLFNELTGMRQKITNIPGTTIENKKGTVKLDSGNALLIDTPGTYSMFPKSLDEIEAVKVINSDAPPDCLIYVADASNLKRNLFYFSQLADLKLPMILVLNMVDVANFKGVVIDTERLEKELGIRIFKVNARSGEGIAALKEALDQKQFVPHYDFKAIAESEHESRYDAIDHLLQKAVGIKNPVEMLSSKLDKLATHPVWGYIIFLGILFLIFQSVFTLAEYPMRWIESGFESLSNYLSASLPDHWIKSLFVNGIIAGLAGVVVFVPQITILFFFMVLLEDTGYMARVSFITDRMLRSLGLSGKSVIPLLSGAACAIPAIMSTRTIENWKDRLITIMVTPLMSCSARLPVYTLLISMAIPNKMILGFMNLQALVLLAMYVLGTAAALLAALAFKFILKHDIPSFFIMELPLYHTPRWKNIWTTCWQKATSFITEAGKVILIVSIVLWFLASYGPKPEQTVSIQEVEQLDQSYAGKIGKSIEPVIKPIGFNWKIGIALITSFAAREVFVGTMSTIYSVENEDDHEQIRNKMRKDTDPATGQPVYSLAVVLSLLVFYAFAMQCMSTLAVVYKETKQWKWPVIQFFYMTGLAYIGSFIVYNLFS